MNFADIWRSDYVSNSLAGRFRPDPFEGIGSDELIARMECLSRSIKRLPPSPNEVAKTALWPITAQRIDDWAAVQANHGLTGPGYKFVFVTPTDDDAVEVEPGRLRQTIEPVGYICHVTKQQLFWSNDGKTFKPGAP